MAGQASTELLVSDAAPRRRGAARGLAGVFGAAVDYFSYIGLGVLLVGVAFPAGAPTAQDVVSGEYGGPWNTRIGPANLVELLVLGVAAIWLVRSLLTRDRMSVFDRWLLFGVLAAGAVQVVAIAINSSSAEFLPLDLERLLIPAAAYLLVTRCVQSEEQLRKFTFLVGAIIIVRAVQLVLFYGVTGETGFGTITGRDALLITEDALLLLFPVVLAWAALLEGRLTLLGMAGTSALIGFTLLVNVLSLRRGALIMILVALAIRVIPIGWRKMVAGCLAALVIFGFLAALGPARSVVSDIEYTAKSALLLTDDDSTSQRTSEIKNFGLNMNPVAAVTGKGLGVTWNVESPAPVDELAFGSGETEFVRIGWHVYGLDWLYKFGLLGLLIAGLVAAKLTVAVRRAYREAPDRMRSLTLSFAVCLVPFLIFTFTNSRIGLMAGLTLGLLALSTRFSEAQTSRRPTRTSGS